MHPNFMHFRQKISFKSVLESFATVSGHLRTALITKLLFRNTGCLDSSETQTLIRNFDKKKDFEIVFLTYLLWLVKHVGILKTH